MQFTDIFLKKPVLAIVVSLFILFLGLLSAKQLNVRKFPQLENAVVTVTTAYVGADANLIQGFVTSPLEREIASAEGIDYITSSSMANVSIVQAYLRLGYKPNEALTQIIAKVNKVRGELPTNISEPTIELAVGDTMAAMYLSFYSEILSNNHITDYLVRIVQPKLATIPGVQRAVILGDSLFAMRIWLKPERMTAVGVSASDVAQALQANHVLTAVGNTKSEMIAIDIAAKTDLNTVEDFNSMVVKVDGHSIVYLRDIAEVALGSANYDISTTFNGQNATFIGIEVAPDANALDVIKQVRQVYNQQIVPQLPEKLSASIPYDSTKYITDSIHEVIKTIIEAIIIVIVVIYLFLGSMRSVIIPAIAVPLSLIGGLFLMYLLGFSINLLTLLAMVLAIGIVVDDAIIVLENIHRHVEAGLSPFAAALKGAAELAWPIVAMTTTLVAVYLPIGFMGGLTGKLFIEFAFTLAGSVLLSGVVALTLSPMMCGKLLRPHNHANKTSNFELWLDTNFNKLRWFYQRHLHNALLNKQVILVFSLIILISCYFLFITANKELEPKEDQGIVLAVAEADPNVTLQYLELYTKQLNSVADTIPEIEKVFLINGIAGAGIPASNSAFAGFVLKSFTERNRTTHEVQQELQAKLQSIAGLQIAVFVPPALPTPGRGFPIEFVIGTTEGLENLQDLANQVVQQAYASKKFIFLTTDLKINKPRYTIKVDRKKAAALGINMHSLGRDLSVMVSGGFTSRFAMQNRAYKIIPQLQQKNMLTPEQLTSHHIKTGSGTLIPLSTIVTLQETVESRQLQRFQQLNSVTISGVPRPGVTIGEALGSLENIANKILPKNYSQDYAGQARQYKQEGNSLILTFFFAFVVIYLVLAAQFESFIDPFIMLITVPMSICGAMIFVSLGFASINIYTQVGLITLIGVISKHGILIVEFANKLQQDGMTKLQAIEEAAAIRLRPVLMTTVALVLAMLPLLLSRGPGAGSRFALGLVVATGMTVGTLFTLFVVPAFYLYLGRTLGNAKHTNASNSFT